MKPGQLPYASLCTQTNCPSCWLMDNCLARITSNLFKRNHFPPAEEIKDKKFRISSRARSVSFPTATKNVPELTINGA